MRVVTPSWLLLAALVAGGAGCRETPPGEDVASRPQDALEPYEMSGFSWVVEDTLAGMPRPGGRGALESDLAFLEEREIGLLVSLTESGTDPDAAAQHGIEVLHLPVPDMTAPTQEQLGVFVVAVSDALARGERVGVHCAAGLGRTGTMLASWFVTRGMTADEAIAYVRAARPGSIETAAQEEAVRVFADAWVAEHARPGGGRGPR